MRIQTFMNYIDDIPKENIYYLGKGGTPGKAGILQAIGGWEVWLQVELANELITAQEVHKIEREYGYPSRAQARCDIYVERNIGSHCESTYIELKCINYKSANPKKNVIQGFIADIDKMRNLLPRGAYGIASMVTYDSPKNIANAITEAKKQIALGDVHIGAIWYECNELERHKLSAISGEEEPTVMFVSYECTK